MLRFILYARQPSVESVHSMNRENIETIFGRGQACGTSGEFIQGSLNGGEQVVLSCPIESGSVVTVRGYRASPTKITGTPAGCTKLHRAINSQLNSWGAGDWVLEVDRRSNLEVGKGMGSSTADIVAAIRALANAFSVSAEPERIAALATAIEPTDAVMYPRLCLVERRTMRPIHRFAWWPDFTILLMIPRDTRATKWETGSRWIAEKDEVDDLVHGLVKAESSRDSAIWGEVATLSAARLQRFFKNPLFEWLESRYSNLGAVGIIIAHTGTVVGLLFDPEQTDPHEIAAHAERIRRHWKNAIQIAIHRVARTGMLQGGLPESD